MLLAPMCNKRSKSIFQYRSPASLVSLRRESSGASRGGKRRNSHQSAVFGEAGNGTVVGISELERLMGVEPTYAAWEAAVLPMNYSRRNGLYYSRPFFILQHEKWRVF